MLGAIREGSLIILLTHPSKMLIDDRGIWDTADPSRRMPMVKQIVGDDGRAREFTLRGLNRRTLTALIVEEERRGGVFTYTPSRDQRRLVGASELAVARRPT